MLRKGISLVFLFLSLCHITAQPAKTAGKAVFTLKTFDEAGALKGSANGFFISQDGQAVSAFTPFKGASRAIIIDADGREWAVDCITGANDMYDVARFQVEKHKGITPLSTAASSTVGSAVWLVPYAVKKTPECPQGTVSKTEQFYGKYDYYTLLLASTDQQSGCPIVNAAGEAVGLTQPAVGKGSDKTYAVSARYAADLRLNGLSLNDPALRSTDLALGIPDNAEDATLSLYMASTVMDESKYTSYLNRFIAQYPQVADGYTYRARQSAAKGDYTAADDDMRQAIANAGEKDNAHYQYALLMLQTLARQQTDSHCPWTLDQALQQSVTAYELSPQAIYRQQQAQILFAQQKYDQAAVLYQELAASGHDKAENLYAASQCKLQAGDRDAALTLADSAVNTFSRPYIRTAAPFLLARGQLLHDMGKYRKAVSDYNDYEALMNAQLTGQFYFLREQAEFAGHLFQQALDDIDRAIEKSPTEPIYIAEKANIQLRVGMTAEAIVTAEECIRIAPEQSDGYLFKGLAQCVSGQRQEGLANLNKAKELGNAQAQPLIEKYSR